MRIFIPTAGRADRQFTLGNIPRKWLQHTALVVPKAQAKQYRPVAEEYGVELLCHGVQRIGPTRHWIMEYAARHGIAAPLMLDDDLKFCVRRTPGSIKLSIAEPKEVDAMLREVKKLTKKHAMVGVSARQGNNHVEDDVKYSTRMNAAYAINPDAYFAEGASFKRLKVMEDFDVTLRLLLAGHRNAVLYKYAWNQHGGSGSTGGCSGWRTAEVQSAAAHKLAKLYPGFVSVVEKRSKSGWEGMQVRHDVRIQWKRAAKAGGAER